MKWSLLYKVHAHSVHMCTLLFRGSTRGPVSVPLQQGSSLLSWGWAEHVALYSFSLQPWIHPGEKKHSLNWTSFYINMIWRPLNFKVELIGFVWKVPKRTTNSADWWVSFPGGQIPTPRGRLPSRSVSISFRLFTSAVRDMCAPIDVNQSSDIWEVALNGAKKKKNDNSTNVCVKMSKDDRKMRTKEMYKVGLPPLLNINNYCKFIYWQFIGNNQSNESGKLRVWCHTSDWKSLTCT